MNKKLIVVIELEVEKEVADIGAEVCRRITMHPHVTDANLVSISESLTHTHAPKPVMGAMTGQRTFIGKD